MLLTAECSSSRHRPDCFGAFPAGAELAASRFGPVYAGRDPSTNARVVVHTFELSPDWRASGKLSDLLDAFRLLCETTLDHPGLPRPLAFGVEGDIPYVVYSDLAGIAMDAAMRQGGARRVGEVLQRTRQLAAAIDFAASRGVHHGAMVPCDVILDGERTGIRGLGLAQALIKAGVPVVASAPYGSPQRIAGVPPTRADDIYSLAAITLELLIGTSADPKQDASRAHREAHGLPERRRVARPAPHETRAFTTIAGVDAGKLRACFAAAFADEPSERPATAAEFVARFHSALSNEGTNDDAPQAVAAASGDEPQKPAHPVWDLKRAQDAARVEPPIRNRPVVAEKRQKQARNQRVARHSHGHEPQLRKPEGRSARAAATVAGELVTVTRPKEPSKDEPTQRIVARLGSRTLLVAMVAAASCASFAAGFGGGFIVGRRVMPPTRSTDVSGGEPVAEPQPERAVEDQKPIASTLQTIAPGPNESVSPSEPITSTAESQPSATQATTLQPTTSQPTITPGVESGRLVVRSTPAGAAVAVDGGSHGVTPLTLRELGFGVHTIEVSHEGHVAQRKRVTLSERRPTRSVDFKLRPRSMPAQAAPAPTDATGSLQVTSRPSGAQVFVDDTLIGTTPLLLSDVAVGSRRLTVQLSGYQMFTTSVEIKPSTRFRLEAGLEP